MHWDQKITCSVKSDIGFRRQNNQDSVTTQICSDRDTWSNYGHLFVVADGMGGHAVGELASKIAVDTVPQSFFKGKKKSPSVSIKEAIQEANENIHSRGSHNSEFDRMGTTCTSLVLSYRGAYVGHVGDSRAYRIRGDRIDQLSFDHSLQWELIRQGKQDVKDILLNEPKHVITRSLGPEAKTEVDVEGPFPILGEDIYVLCSDGLTGHLKDAEIGMICKSLHPDQATQLMTDLANLRGGSDNITIIVTHVGKSESNEPFVFEEEEDPDSGGISSWLWFVAFCGILTGVVISVMLFLFQHVIYGLFMSAITVGATGYTILKWLKARQSYSEFEMLNNDESPSETIIWRPYRTANAVLSSPFVKYLMSVESELQRSALENGWAIDWGSHDEAHRQATEFLAKNQLNKSMTKIAKAIHILMNGLKQHRKDLAKAKK